MTKTSIAVLAAAAALAATAASAQTAKENYSYTAPSGMFGEGTWKWQYHRFIAEDQERMERQRRGETTGSMPLTVQGSAGDNTVGQPGRRTTRRTN